MLKGQDIVIALLIASEPGKIWTQPEIVSALTISLGEVNNALKRGYRSGILRREKQVSSTNESLLHLKKLRSKYPMMSTLPDSGLVSGYRPVISALEELILHGLKFFFPAIWGEVVRGVPTAHGAPELSSVFVSTELPPVWAHPNGPARGLSLEPIHQSVPSAALTHPGLYELLALADVFRIGRSREITLARDLLRQRLRGER